jgi:dihydroorotate dehydrogenase
MNSLSRITATTYKKAAKPVLFAIPPDHVHKGMLATGKLVQRSRFLRLALHEAWAAPARSALTQNLHGITFTNPVGLSAGFDKNIELAPLIKAVGFGFMEGGTITRLPYKGNDRPWFHRLPEAKSLTVHVGLANQGVHKILKRVASYPAATFDRFPLNISVGATNGVEGATAPTMVRDFAETIKAVQRANVAKMITLNISCPNIYAGEVFTKPGNLELLLEKTDSLNLACPLFIKMPCDISLKQFDTLLATAARHNVTGITLSNLTKDYKNIRGGVPAHVKGGLSGKPTFKKSNELISYAYKKYGSRFTIIGVGGIFTAKDAYEKIKRGASLVELITGMIYEGPQLIGHINEGLVKLLAADGFKSISEAIGSAHRKKQGML